jgi:hypothetical protein
MNRAGENGPVDEHPILTPEIDTELGCSVIRYPHLDVHLHLYGKRQLCYESRMFFNNRVIMT